MTGDIATIIWKEFKEILMARPGLRGGWLGMLVLLGVMGVFLPLQMGAAWVSQPTILLYWLWVPFILITSVIADSFAGERERHTLETLLASRLSDRAILFGKIGAAILYGWGFTLVALLTGLVTVNVAAREGRLLLYSWDAALLILAGTLLVSLLASGLGVLISLRAPTVRQAQQTLGMVSMLAFVPLFLLPFLPASIQRWLQETLANLSVTGLVLALLIFLIVLDTLILAAVLRRFQRARLILD